MKYLLILTVLWNFSAFGQMKLNADKSTMVITGTSSLHDWEMTVNEFDVTATITDTQVQNLKVTIKSKSMESGKSIMDDKAYDAVEADDYPEILFTAKSLQISGGKITGKGNLTIAGESREIDLTAQILKNGSSEMQIQGSVPLKMTDFDIEPPTAMFGTLKTGDEVVINYDITITK
ncbi:MAG: YceI family protein [Ekhidna sp.]|uniref:YceI family protein n=1 Tax=Ekhidna sp. TaxID=2608089 RepID=UPI0032EF9A1B